MAFVVKQVIRPSFGCGISAAKESHDTSGMSASQLSCSAAVVPMQGYTEPKQANGKIGRTLLR